MRQNWFVAFPIDGSFFMGLPAPPPPLRLLHTADVHLTLSFLGGCGEEPARRGLAALDAELAVRPQAPLEVTLGEVVAMGPSPDYSALSALLDRGRAETEASIARLGNVVRTAALGRREERAPKAHVTLARPGRRATDAARRAGLEWAASLDLSAASVRLDRISLYTWSDGDRRERRFRVVAERSLPAALNGATN